MSYRQFKLINSVGAEYDLCNERHRLNSPDGLGFDKTFEVVQIGSAFAMAENNLNQQTVTGEMVFRDYADYSEFVDFISVGNLTIAYQPRNFTTWYYRSCEVKSLKKSEISSSTHRLHCDIDFLCFSQWYESVFAERTNDFTGENTTFPLIFPFVFVDANINEVNIYNSNVSLAPCKIEITGPCVNPQWVLSADGQITANGEVKITLGTGEKLIIDSNIESMRIVKVRGNVETNVYQYSNFETDRFIYAPSGKSVLRFYHDSYAALDVTVEVRKVADTV